MRKLLYFSILAVTFLMLFIMKDRVCIRCIEIEDNIRLTTSIEELNELFYRYASCPNCKANN